MGYCYNIKSYLDEHPCAEIDFYPESDCLQTNFQNDKQPLSFKTKISTFLSKNKYTGFSIELYRTYFKKIPLTIEENNLLKKYDFVHIHWAQEILQTFSNFNNGKTKVILTTHTPEPLFDELAGRFGVQVLLKRLPFIRNFFLKKEVEAYKNANFVMFPTLEAKEPYTNRSPYHKAVLKQIEDKTFYVPTAINHLKVAPENKHYLDALKISENALKVCYVGRHNEIKGYDFLQKIALHTWKNNPNIFFIIGGKEEPLKGLNDKRWIELGWVTTYELLNEIDVFILSNKETYFDIILLEVLRQGVPVLITKTGGNKWFERKNISGIHCFDYGDINSCCKILEELHFDKINGKLDQQKKANIDFFEKNLSMSKYIENYTSSLKKLM